MSFDGHLVVSHVAMTGITSSSLRRPGRSDSHVVVTAISRPTSAHLTSPHLERAEVRPGAGDPLRCRGLRHDIRRAPGDVLVSRRGPGAVKAAHWVNAPWAAAAGFDKGTLAMAQIGLTRAGQKPARSPDSVRAIAPCQIPPLRLLTTFSEFPAIKQDRRAQVHTATQRSGRLALPYRQGGSCLLHVCLRQAQASDHTSTVAR
jgi:hypothetical protein